MLLRPRRHRNRHKRKPLEPGSRSTRMGRSNDKNRWYTLVLLLMVQKSSDHHLLSMKPYEKLYILKKQLVSRMSEPSTEKLNDYGRVLEYSFAVTFDLE